MTDFTAYAQTLVGVSELMVSLATPATAYDDLTGLLSNHMRRYSVLPQRVLVPFVLAQALQVHQQSGSDLSVWETIANKCERLGVTLVALAPVRVVAHFQLTLSVPRLPRTANMDVQADFNRAGGYEDGNCNREPRYSGEAREYGLSADSLVPIKWPEPPGFTHAAWLLNAGQEQVITVEVLSDGTRRIVSLESATGATR